MELKPRQLSAAIKAIKAKATSNSTSVNPPDQRTGLGRRRVRQRPSTR